MPKTLSVLWSNLALGNAFLILLERTPGRILRLPWPAAVLTRLGTVAPGELRRLRIGEAADPRWRADLDSTPLGPVTEGWQQAFQLPAGGGR